MPTVKELIEQYSKYAPDETIAYSVWEPIDVIERAAENDVKVTEEQARKILERVHSEHDCNEGINWDIIDYFTDEVLDDE